MEQGDVVDQLYFVYHGELVSIPVTHQFVYLYIFLYMSFSNSDLKMLFLCIFAIHI